jgi:DNA mismatch endonuclease (patch repair protein)
LCQLTYVSAEPIQKQNAECGNPGDSANLVLVARHHGAQTTKQTKVKAMRRIKKRKDIQAIVVRKDLGASGKGDVSWAVSPAVRRVMQGNRPRDTKPEIAVRCAVHALGMRYRMAMRPIAELRRTADLVFPRARIAVFVDGCFWHGCPAHHSQPKTNADYWATKIATNKARDAHTTTLLKAAGWTVMRFWSHEEPSGVAARIAARVHNKQLRKIVLKTKSRRIAFADQRRS